MGSKLKVTDKKNLGQTRRWRYYTTAWPSLGLPRHSKVLRETGVQRHSCRSPLMDGLPLRPSLTSQGPGQNLELQGRARPRVGQVRPDRDKLIIPSDTSIFSL